VRRVEYADFDLLVQRAGGGFEARVLHSPVGETGMVPFAEPFSALELENFLLKIGRPRSAVRGLGSAESSAVRDFGGRLFEGVFRAEVRDCLVSSLNQAEGRGVGLRLRLRLADCPELADLPWECLYDPGRRRHLALSAWTPLIRYLDLPGVVRPLEVTPPLRMLVLIANPTDYAALDVEQEFANLHRAVDSLVGAGRLVVDRLPDGTLAALQQQLRREEYHVFHYVGHGGYDATGGDGVLVLEGPEGRGQHVGAQDLATLLCDYRTLRLVVLNSCEGARGGLDDPYGGTAQTLIQQGIPAVVAMQFEITDTAAIDFSHTFYSALSDGYPVEAATAEARKTVKNSPNPVEWATPVLYLRAPDGHLFNFTDPAPDPSVTPAAGAPHSVAGQARKTLAKQLFDEARPAGADQHLADHYEKSATGEPRAPSLTYVPEPGVLQVGQNVVAIAFSPDGTRLATGSRHRVRIWDLRNGTTIWEKPIGGLTKDVTGLAFSPDGTRLATASYDNFAYIWDAATGERQLQVGQSDPVMAVAFSPDGTRVATGGEGFARIWDAATGERQLEVGHAKKVRALAFSPDGARLATASHDNFAYIWDAATGERQLQVGHAWVVHAVAFSPDGARLATGSWDTSARIRDATTGQLQLQVLHTGWVHAVAFSPDGTRLATASDDNSAQIWDAVTGKPQVQVLHTRPVRAVAFSPDGTRLATGSNDKTARISDAAIRK
jgi:WD40 repeat protein